MHAKNLLIKKVRSFIKKFYLLIRILWSRWWGNADDFICKVLLHEKWKFYIYYHVYSFSTFLPYHFWQNSVLINVIVNTCNLVTWPIAKTFLIGKPERIDKFISHFLDSVKNYTAISTNPYLSEHGSKWTFSSRNIFTLFVL